MAIEVKELQEENLDMRQEFMRMKKDNHKLRIEKIWAEKSMAYVESQLVTLQSAPNVSTTAQSSSPAANPGSSSPHTPSTIISTKATNSRFRTMKLFDPLIFDGNEKDQISFDNWLLQIQNKILINKITMPTD